MFFRHKGCTKEVICDLECWVPPVGKGINVLSGDLVEVEVITCSDKPEDQVWFRTKLPSDWDKRRAAELRRQQTDEDFIDDELEDFREREWKRRLNGVWVMINGKPVYLTGLHYFYLNWWNIGLYPNYREPDRKYFYFLMYCMLDPECLGVNEVTKRKQGKTARSGVWMYERMSRTYHAWGGIQSKTGEDAKNNVFLKYIQSPFTKLPDFFVPVYDTGRGDRNSTALRFYKPSAKGKRVGMDNREELESTIDHRTTALFSYDSQVLYSYICDEAGKFIDIDVYSLQQVVRYCCELDGEFKGKMLYTTTVEEMENGGEGFLKLTKASDQKKRNANGRTESGLYTFFTPAFETMYYDKYGMPDIERGKKYFQAERKSLEHDPIALNNHIRKNPFTLEEAFRVSSSNTIYNVIKLNERLSLLEFMDNVTTRGNFMWKDGVRDTEVVFKPSVKGRWEVTWLFDDPEQANHVRNNHGQFIPLNKTLFVTGIDPYEVDVTVDERRSDGASLTLKKFNAIQVGDPFNYAFICKYRFRQPTAKQFYEDMIMQCFYYGSPAMIEDNRPGLVKYFEERGYGKFLLWLPGATKPGVTTSKKVHQQMAEVTEEYIENQIDTVNFADLITDWINFDITKTTKYDLAMAAGFTLIADQLIVPRTPTKSYEVKEFFRRRKVPAC